MIPVPFDANSQIASLIFAVVLLDPDLRIREMNSSAETFFGQSAKRLAGEVLTERLKFVDERLESRLGDVDAQLIARRIAVRAGGAAHVVNLTLSPISGHSGWRILTLSDAGQDERYGEGVEDAAARMPAILAHEIKNPLAAIRGAAQLAGRKGNAKVSQLTDLITGEVDRIASLIDRMQSLGKETPAPNEPCNLHEAIRRACQVVAAAEREEGTEVELVEEFDPSLPPVMANFESLVQVLLNLIGNARDACGQADEPRVEIRTRFVSGLVLRAFRLGKPVSLPIELRVTDNGPGVDPKIADQIFEPFVTSKRDGEGLGLALVRKLVTDMHGRIAIERDDRAGLTHFRVNLPLAEGAEK